MLETERADLPLSLMRGRCPEALQVWAHFPSSRPSPIARREGDHDWHFLVGLALSRDCCREFFSYGDKAAYLELLAATSINDIHFGESNNFKGVMAARVGGAAPEFIASVGTSGGGAEDHFAFAFGANFAGVVEEGEDFKVMAKKSFGKDGKCAI